jgi:hypothetical protein
MRAQSGIVDAAFTGNLRHAVHDGEVRIAIVKVVGKGVSLGPQGFTTVQPVAISSKKASRKRTPGNKADALILAEWNHFSFFFAINQIVMILHGNEAAEAQRVRHVSIRCNCDANIDDAPM